MDFTIENKEEVKQIVNMFKNKLNNASVKKNLMQIRKLEDII